MLVKFVSSETSGIIMYVEHARPLLQAMGHECRAQGAITQPELAEALRRLRQAVADAPVESTEAEVEDQEGAPAKPPVISMAQRAWPLLNMLERTAAAGKDASVTWTAPADFG